VATTSTNAIARFCYQPRRSAFRLWMFNLHLYTGLALGILTTLVGITGSIVVYKPEIERGLAGAMTRIAPAGAPEPLTELYNLAAAAVPHKKVERLFIWGGPTAAWAFRVSDARGNRDYVYVDPYSGRVLGHYPMDGTWLQWAYNLHDNLLMEKPGLIINGAGALLLVVMCLTGTVVWWPGATRVRHGFRYHPRAGWKGQVYDFHKILGIVSMLILAVIAISGASYSFPDSYHKVCAALTRTVSFVPPPRARPASQAPLASLDSILRAGQQAIPEAELTVLTWPTDPKGAFLVRKRLSGDWSRLGNQYVYLDPHTGAVLREDRTARMSGGRWLMQAMAPLHYGSFGGHWTRILWILMGLLPGVLSITGFLMWWNRVVAKKQAAVRAAHGQIRPSEGPALGSA
jgi:uncharacterized iron-regulated membrane protein